MNKSNNALSNNKLSIMENHIMDHMKSIKTSNTYSIKRIIFTLTLSLITLCAYAYTSSAATPPTMESPLSEIEEFMEFSADSAEYDETTDTVKVLGNVRITFSDIALSADELMIFSASNTVEVDGRIELNKNKLSFHGNGLEYNYKTGRGILKRGQVRVEGLNLAGEEIEISPDLITMHSVTGTTCEFGKEDYHIRARELEIKTDGRARLKKISFHYRDRRLFGVPAFTFAVASKSDKTLGGKGSAGRWSYSSPAMRYSRFGGLELRAGVRRMKGNGDNMGVDFDYYMQEGMFTETRWQRPRRNGFPEINLRVGKQYKENAGYFRNTNPRIVWNQPTLEVGMRDRALMNTRLSFGGNFELGKLKEAQTKDSVGRFFTKMNASYPINPGDRIKYALVGDGRYGIYDGWNKYRVLGAGINAETGNIESDYTKLEYLRFRHGGATPFFSDLVNTNSKLFAYAARMISPRTQVYADSQYDLGETRFDETIFGAVRRYNCIKFYAKYHTERKQIGIGVQLLNLRRK